MAMFRYLTTIIGFKTRSDGGNGIIWWWLSLIMASIKGQPLGRFIEEVRLNWELHTGGPCRVDISTTRMARPAMVHGESGPLDSP